ncbi:radical SAM/SPASM domain-containing protein [Hyunsoonleella aestuarii]|uniref:Radical SAM core domain-containing protein n=1 Tax=Hyunsoonleella aestuarii TaxID=912802 RepID=A0ABP8EDF5_9FLAO|nr:radical SAM protein [Hyunsoonleella aestuarii]
MIAEFKEKKAQETTSLISTTIDTSNGPKFINGLRLKLVQLKIKFTLLKVILKCYYNPIVWIQSLRYLIKLRRRFLGNIKVHKMVYINGKYHIGLYTPGWNSSLYEKFIASNLNDFKPIKLVEVNRFNNIFFAITKKCALQCEHCFEWDNLNKKETLSDDQLMEVVKRIQDKGVSQIHLSGGEPLIRMDAILKILNHADKSTNFWVVTSGFKLNNTNAKRLKEAGLKGAVISLDHFIPEKHNTFRNFKDAFYWVEEAVKNANNNNLITALSLCTTKDFISEENLMSYMELAKKLKVSFVQFLEPKAVGHYVNKDVLLNPQQIGVLENFFIKMNFTNKFGNYPLITYHGYYQRRQGCLSAGKKGIYIDTDGDMNPCPFCHKKNGNVLDSNFNSNLNILQSAGCSSYN